MSISSADLQTYAATFNYDANAVSPATDQDKKECQSLGPSTLDISNAGVLLSELSPLDVIFSDFGVVALDSLSANKLSNGKHPRDIDEAITIALASGDKMTVCPQKEVITYSWLPNDD